VGAFASEAMGVPLAGVTVNEFGFGIARAKENKEITATNPSQ
jgi:adenine/guanine phosphoribosyltransferase-like PRPP-binding protein